MDRQKSELPRVVPEKDWKIALQEILKKEKQLTKRQDDLSAERRKLPMVEVDKEYFFEGPNGKLTLLDLFDGRKQLIVYNAMLEPGAEPCKGCSMVMDNIGHNISHVRARNTNFVFTSPAPQKEILALQKEMEWDAPWYTDIDRKFADAFDAGKSFGVNVFIRDDGNRIYRTYFTTGRGGEIFDTHFRLLDITPYGRQENWEDSPEGWPQSEPYVWWKLHNEYE